ncbi:Pre-mRNA-splicing factor SLU7-A [Glycine soja]
MNLIPKVNFFSTIKKFPACWVLPWPTLLLISAAMLRNLADKLYEKHKNAALDIEGIVKQLATAGDHDKITANLLIDHKPTIGSQIKTREIVALKKIRMDNERERLMFLLTRTYTATEVNWPGVSKTPWYNQFKPTRPMKRRLREVFRHLSMRHSFCKVQDLMQILYIILNPNSGFEITAKSHHSKLDTNVYEGRRGKNVHIDTCYNTHAWEAFEKGQDIHMQAAPSQAELLYKNFKIIKEKLKSQTKNAIVEKYGNAASQEELPKELLLGQTERQVEYDRAGRIIEGLVLFNMKFMLIFFL